MENSDYSLLRSYAQPQHDKNDTQIVVKKMKIVLVGDVNVGKSSLLLSYIYDNFNKQYKPTVLQIYPATLKTKDFIVQMNIFDITGSNQYKKYRSLSYNDADVFLICFSLVQARTFYHALERWLPEIQEKNPKALKIFVGTKNDIFEDNSLSTKKKPLSLRIEGLMAKVKQTGHNLLICSATDEESVRQVFITAIKQVFPSPPPLSSKIMKKVGLNHDCNIF